MAREPERLVDRAAELVAEAVVDAADADTAYARTVERLLRLLRAQLGMQVAWISEFGAGEQVYRFVDAADGCVAPAVGDSAPLSSTYCAQVLAGRIPSVIPDTRAEPAAAMLEATFTLHVGAYLGVSLTDTTGVVSGRMCLVSNLPMPALGERDLLTVQLVADLVQDLHRRLVAGEDAQRRSAALRRRLEAIIAGDGRHPVVQPIRDIATRSVVAVEALTRFGDPEYQPPQWFDLASTLGLRRELEIAAAEAQLELLDLPDGPPVVAVNLSPSTIASGALDALLASHDPARVIVEVTEYAPVEDYDQLHLALAPHRVRGLRVAIDDVGAGYANLAHVLAIRPDVVKIDMSLVQGLTDDKVRQALVTALVSFAAEVGATLVAEGVESEADLDTLARLHVPMAQGFVLDQPASWQPAAR